MCPDVLSADVLGPDAGAPASGRVRSLTSVESCVDVGLREVACSTDDLVKADEVFLVLDGRGTVTFEDRSTIDLEPGVLVHLRRGDHTTWVVHHRMRGLYTA